MICNRFYDRYGNILALTPTTVLCLFTVTISVTLETADDHVHRRCLSLAAARRRSPLGPAHPVTDNWAITREKVEVLTPCGFPMFWETYGKPEAAYEPLETASGLFRELAALDPGPEADTGLRQQIRPADARATLRAGGEAGETASASSPPVIYARASPAAQHRRAMTTSWNGLVSG